MQITTARNFIARALGQVLDPGPTVADKAHIWDYFESRCAYCGETLRRAERKGHLDHLVPTSADGHNGLSNRVLCCWICNGDERREMEWTQFLKKKCGEDDSLYKSRYARIVEWQGRDRPSRRVVPTPEMAAVLNEAKASLDAFRSACDKLKMLVAEYRRVQRAEKRRRV
jgi:hypothetical protein